ncbi:hypothetical protein B0H19DRAFT_1083039 [Mycena capillaripes]|nr:hypothetical protein B0H19DRAFT_1083039 [Mycena capillaripes]
MPVASLASLPAELLQEIGGNWECDQKNLRTVCKSLRDAINPLYFSTVTVVLSGQRPDRGLCRLEAIASGETSWSTYARTLSISANNYYYDNERLEEEDKNPFFQRIKQSLDPALASLKHIKTLSWAIHERHGYPEWINDIVIDALPSFSDLNDLSLSGDLHAVMSRTGLQVFDQLGNFHKLRLSGTDYVRDKVSAKVSLKIYKAISRSPQLTTLYLSAPSADFSAVWNILRTESIHITDFTASTVTHEMLCYLSSYSGLTRLTVEGAVSEVPSEELALADAFFLSALSKHAETLVHLSCSASIEGKWGLTPSNSDVLSRMTSVHMADLGQNGDTVELLLDAIPNLPSLATIIIVPSRLRVSRPVCGGFFENHRIKTSQRIRQIMRAYRSAVPLHLVVDAGYRRFEPKLKSDEEGEWWGIRRFLTPVGGSSDAGSVELLHRIRSISRRAQYLWGRSQNVESLNGGIAMAVGGAKISTTVAVMASRRTTPRTVTVKRTLSADAKLEARVGSCYASFQTIVLQWFEQGTQRAERRGIRTSRTGKRAKWWGGRPNHERMIQGYGGGKQDLSADAILKPFWSSSERDEAQRGHDALVGGVRSRTARWLCEDVSTIFDSKWKTNLPALIELDPK